MSFASRHGADSLGANRLVTHELRDRTQNSLRGEFGIAPGTARGS